jgi:hypothetical protein
MKLRRTTDGGYSFWCPGCNEPHVLSKGWAFSGTEELPTFNPSVLVTVGHYTPGWQAGMECWCSYAKAHPDEGSFYLCSRCHSFVKAGQIQFLGDCTHALKDKTVPLPDWPES